MRRSTSNLSWLIIIVSCVVSMCQARGNSQGRIQKLRNIKPQVGGGCNFTSDNGNIGISSRGTSGQVVFYRRGPNNGSIARAISILPQFLREFDGNNEVKIQTGQNRGKSRQASGFSDKGTTISWNCNATTEMVDDGNGGTKSVDVLQSQWSAEKTVVRATSPTKLMFNVKLYTAQYNVLVCPRKYNRTKIVPRSASTNANCSIIAVLPGLKWEFVVDNWPYAKATNHLRFGLKISGHTRKSKKLPGLRSIIRKKGMVGKRKRAARKIISFGSDGYLDNPEEADVACAGQAPQNVTVGISTKVAGNNVFIMYDLPATGDNCVISYDPLMNDGQNTTNAAADNTNTGGVSTFSSIFALSFVTFFSLLV